MADNISRRLLGSLPLKLISLAVGFCVFFVATPALVKYFGNYVYGLIILTQTIVGYFSMVEFGMGTALERELSVAYGQDNRALFQKSFATGSVFFLGIAAVSLVAVAITMVCASLVSSPQLVHLLGLAGLGLVVIFLFQPFQSALIARLRFGQIYFLNILQSAGVLCLTYLTVHLQWSASVYVFSTVVVLFLNRLIMLGSVVCMDDWVQVHFKNVKKHILKKLFSFSVKTAMIRFAALLNAEMDKLLVGGLLGVCQVTMYGLAADTNSRTKVASNILSDMCTPVFSFLHGRGNCKKFMLVYMLIWKIMLLINGLTLVLVLAGGPRFIALWLGPQYHEVVAPLCILALAYFIQKIHGPGENVLYAYNQHQYYATLYFFEGVISVVAALASILIFHAGIVGVACSILFAAIVVRSVWQTKILVTVLKISLGAYVLRIASMLIKCVLPLLGVAYAYVWLCPQMQYLQLIGLLVLCSLGALLCTYVILNERELDYLWFLVKRAMEKKLPLEGV